MPTSEDRVMSLTLLMLTASWSRTSALSSMGKIFLVTSPKLNISLVKQNFRMKFHLSTFEESEFKVKFSVPHFKENVTKELVLRPRGVTKFTPDQKFIPVIDVGHFWTFRFVGSKHFGLTVVMINSVGGLATFQALPVDAWGKFYYAVTGKWMPFILVTSDSDDNAVVVTLSQYSNPVAAVFVYENNTYKSQDKMEFTLKRWESFAISNCSYGDGNETLFAHLDGTAISSKRPIGVISGGCVTKIEGAVCSNDKVLPDMMAEMMFPTVMSRRAFLFPNIPGRIEPGSLLYVTWEDNSNVSIFNEVSTDHRSFFGTVVSSLPVFIKNYFISSNTGILVLYEQTSACKGDKSEPMETGPNLCLIMPTEFFHYRYIWRTPDVGTQNFLLIVTKSEDKEHLLLDSKPLPNSAKWEGVFYATNYTVGNLPVTVGDHVLMSREGFRFACYVYGMGQKSAYMHSVGFQDCNPEANTSFYGDLVDTDCDGQVDDHVEIKEKESGLFPLVYIIIAIIVGAVLLICIAVLCKKACTKKTSQVTADTVEVEEVQAPSAVEEVEEGDAAASVAISHHSGSSKRGPPLETASSHVSYKTKTSSRRSTKTSSHLSTQII